MLTHNSRSNSREKWYILASISTLWIASYYCILCNSALEDDMIKLFNLSNTEFALFSTISFACAVIGSLITLPILKVTNIYNAMLLSSFFALIGQTIFVIGIIFALHLNRNWIYFMYFGRIWIGTGYGIQNVLIYSTINIWFEKSKWLTFALNVVNSTYELGILISRYAMQPIYGYTNQLFAPFCIGIVLSLISIICCFIMIFIENKFNSQLALSNFLDNDFTQMKYFNFQTQLIIIIIIIGWAGLETFGNQFTVPLMKQFGISEWYVDLLLSIQAVYALTFGQICAYFISKYGYLSYYFVLSQLCATVSMSVFYFYDNTWPISPIPTVWIAVIVYIAGVEHFFSVSFACLFMVCPSELTAIVNTVTSVGFMIGSTLQAYLFGAIADYSSYSYAILMCFCLCLFGLITGIIVWTIDIMIDGPLHRSTKYNQYKKLSTYDIEGEGDVDEKGTSTQSLPLN